MAEREEWPSSAAAVRKGCEGGNRIRLTAHCDAFCIDHIDMTSYLVTGGAGFIGSHLAEELVRRGHRVRIVDNLVTGNRRNLEHVQGAEFVEGDLADFSVCRRVVQGIDYVL